MIPVLPAGLRNGAWQTSKKLLLARTRYFHASPRLRASVIETCCSQSFELMDTLHGSTGLSWVFVLPITALAIRSTFVAPLSIWARMNLKRLSEIQPLLLSWMPKIQKDVYRNNPGIGKATYLRIVKQEHNKKTIEIRRRLGISVWSAYAPLLQLPIFLVFIESIRQMCSMSSGLLRLLSSWISGGEYQKTINVQASLADEGALWFPDLLLPDPYYILPVVLSGLLYANIAYNQRRQEILRPSQIHQRVVLTTVMKGLSIGMLLVTPQLPAAMLVYWVSSSALALLTTYTLEHIIPIAPMMVPCKPLVRTYQKNLSSVEQGKPKSAFSRWVSENL